MLITRANPKGGRPLTGYPLQEDIKTGNLGYKIGYCSCGCNEPILIRTIDVSEIVDKFGLSDRFYRKRLLSFGIISSLTSKFQRNRQFDNSLS